MSGADAEDFEVLYEETPEELVKWRNRRLWWGGISLFLVLVLTPVLVGDNGFLDFRFFCLPALILRVVWITYTEVRGAYLERDAIVLRYKRGARRIPYRDIDSLATLPERGRRDSVGVVILKDKNYRTLATLDFPGVAMAYPKLLSRVATSPGGMAEGVANAAAARRRFYKACMRAAAFILFGVAAILWACGLYAYLDERAIRRNGVWTTGTVEACTRPDGPGAHVVLVRYSFLDGGGGRHRRETRLPRIHAPGRETAVVYDRFRPKKSRLKDEHDRLPGLMLFCGCFVFLLGGAVYMAHKFVALP